VGVSRQDDIPQLLPKSQREEWRGPSPNLPRFVGWGAMPAIGWNARGIDRQIPFYEGPLLYAEFFPFSNFYL
jgi:hypothetical protein